MRPPAKLAALEWVESVRRLTTELGATLSRLPTAAPALWPSSPSGPTAFHKYVGRSLSHVKILFTKPDSGDR